MQLIASTAITFEMLVSVWHTSQTPSRVLPPSANELVPVLLKYLTLFGV